MATTKKTTTKAKEAPPKPTKAVARTEAGGTVARGAEQLPEHLRQYAGMGTETIKTSDIVLPRLALMQATSEEPKVFDGLQVGDFFHTLLEKALGERIPKAEGGGSRLEIVPLYHNTRYVLWRPRPPIDLGGILARADDGVHWSPPNVEFTVKLDRKGNTTKWKTAKTVQESGLDAWGTYDPSDPNSPPAATKCQVVVVALPDYPDVGPVALFLQRSAISPSQKFLGKLKMSPAPIFGRRFIMKSVEQQGPSGPFWNYAFESDGFVEDAAEVETYHDLHKQFKSLGVSIRDLEAAQEDGGADVQGAESTRGEKRY